jgi:hypothetical protein
MITAALGRALAASATVIAVMKPATCTIRMDTSRGGCCIARNVHFVKPVDLAKIPSAHNLLRGDRLSLRFGAFRLGCGTGGGALPFLRSAVRTHRRRLSAAINLGQAGTMQATPARAGTRLVQIGNSRMEFSEY